MSGLIDLDEVAGARASHRYARLSATKARVVLDLIRNEDVDRAAEILRLCERGAAEVVEKVLRSAVSNAIHNEGLDADQLYVAECYADEGPTLKRFRPRSRGRAGRIRKRTCHITLIVAQLDAADLAAREAARGRAVERGATAGDRRARVAASRRAAGQPEAAEIASTADDADAVDATAALAADVEPDADAAAEEAVSEDAVTEEAVSEDAVTEEAVSEDAVTEEAVTEDAVTDDAVTEEAVAEVPATDEDVAVEETPTADAEETEATDAPETDDAAATDDTTTGDDEEGRA